MNQDRKHVIVNNKNKILLLYHVNKYLKVIRNHKIL